MTLHGQLLWQCKEKKGMLEARKHLVQYLHSFPNVKEYRGKLVQVEDIHDIQNVIQSIYTDHADLLDTRLQVDTAGAMAEAWGAECG
jgi:tRNA-dihydrouridine synthase